MPARLVLLDADVVIELFRLGIWDRLLGAVPVSLASTVVDEAGHYYDPDTGAKRIIDLQPYISDGRVTVENGDVAEIVRIRDACKLLELHIGELESMAVVASADCHFCTADRAAAKAMVLLDLSEKALSLEGLLKRHGVQPKRKPRPHFSQAQMKSWLKEGGVLKVESAKLL
jgi:hypothetical protein